MHTEQEIIHQTETLISTVSLIERQGSELAAVLSDQIACDELIFTGCGSSYYIALSAAAYANRVLKIPSRALVSSEILLSPETVLLKERRRVAVVFSRSGETTEALLAAKKLKDEYGSLLLGITCTPESTVSTIADFVLDLNVPEESVAMTRTFTAMLLSITMLINKMGAKSNTHVKECVNEVPSLIGISRGCFDALDLSLYEHVELLGTGELVGVVYEGALKCKEMAKCLATGYPAMDYRHGPKTLASSKTLIIIQKTRSSENSLSTLTEELRGIGATVLTIGPQNSDIITCEKTDEGEDAFYRVVPLQLLSLALSKVKGLDPDNPANLTRVVKL
jgi:glucosamine--fructose-6-phosphate aminotransferase (isomerizing)